MTTPSSQASVSSAISALTLQPLPVEQPRQVVATADRVDEVEVEVEETAAEEVQRPTIA